MIAVFVSVVTSYDRQVRLAEELRASGEEIVFVLPKFDEDLAYRLQTELSDWKVISLRKPRNSARQRRPWFRLSDLTSRLVDRIDFAREIRTIFQMRHLVDTLKKRFQPAAAIFDLDNRFGMSYVGSRLAKEGIPSFVVPGWFADEKELLFAGQFRKANALQAAIAKRWVSQTIVLAHRDFGPIIPFSVTVLLLRKLLGYLPPKPWILHSGFSTKILCESEAHRKLGISYGLEPSNLEVTGSVLLGSIDAELRSAANSEMSTFGKDTEAGMPAVLIAIPYPPGKNFAKPSALASDYNNVLAQFLSLEDLFPGVNFIWNLHPSLSAASFVELLSERKRIAISDRTIIQDLARSSALIGCGSSVLAWGLAVGMPVGNWDVYGMGYGDYALSDQIYSQEWDGLENIVNSALSVDFVKGGRKSWQFWETTKNPEWGIIDSHASARVTSAIKSALSMSE